jgi:hypothetical protein
LGIRTRWVSTPVEAAQGSRATSLATPASFDARRRRRRGRRRGGGGGGGVAVDGLSAACGRRRGGGAHACHAVMRGDSVAASVHASLATTCSGRTRPRAAPGAKRALLSLLGLVGTLAASCRRCPHATPSNASAACPHGYGRRLLTSCPGRAPRTQGAKRARFLLRGFPARLRRRGRGTHACNASKRGCSTVA